MMEAVVSDAIGDIKKHYDFCDCEHCRMDIAALVLNKVPPRYVVTTKGDSYGRADLLALQKNVDITSLVLEAIKIVQQQPRH